MLQRPNKRNRLCLEARPAERRRPESCTATQLIERKDPYMTFDSTVICTVTAFKAALLVPQGLTACQAARISEVQA